MNWKSEKLKYRITGLDEKSNCKWNKVIKVQKIGEAYVVEGKDSKIRWICNADGDIARGYSIGANGRVIQYNKDGDTSLAMFDLCPVAPGHYIGEVKDEDKA